MTLALPKNGLLTPEAKPYTGELYLADISVPPKLYQALGIEAPHIFIHDSVISYGESFKPKKDLKRLRK